MTNAGLSVYRGGLLIALCQPTAPSYEDTGAVPNGYSYRVYAYHASTNYSLPRPTWYGTGGAGRSWSY
jgi:hypothetical protein